MAEEQFKMKNLKFKMKNLKFKIIRPYRSMSCHFQFYIECLYGRDA